MKQLIHSLLLQFQAMLSTDQVQKIQHNVRVSLQQFAALWEKIWFKIFIGLIVVVILWKKDLHLSFNLEGSTESTPQEQTQPILLPQPVVQPPKNSRPAVTTPQKAPEEAVSIFDLTNFLLLEASTYRTSNLGNTFSNISIVLNPDYYKRKKVNRAVVAEKERIVAEYVEKFAPIAVSEMKLYGIPASITLAQGLLESDAGGSQLARLNNNHFGIKCFLTNCSKGHCVNYTDDSHKDFFRNYSSSWSSYRAHSLFLQKPRYAALKKYGTTAYKKWAVGLREAGYATDKKYANKLIQIIETLDLQRFDEAM